MDVVIHDLQSLLQRGFDLLVELDGDLPFLYELLVYGLELGNGKFEYLVVALPGYPQQLVLRLYGDAGQLASLFAVYLQTVVEYCALSLDR
jgi:hypothetical protein